MYQKKHRNLLGKELFLIRAIQSAIVVNTVILAGAVYFARQKNYSLHQKLNLFVIASTYLGIAGLAITLAAGWDYSALATPERLQIHKWFSVPLFFLLLPVGYFGWKKNRKAHLTLVPLVLFFWTGTLITGLWFF